MRRTDLETEAVALWRPDDQHPWREWESDKSDEVRGEMRDFVPLDSALAEDGRAAGGRGAMLARAVKATVGPMRADTPTPEGAGDGMTLLDLADALIEGRNRDFDVLLTLWTGLASRTPEPEPDRAEAHKQERPDAS